MSLTLQEARARAALISEIDTTVHLDLTATEQYAVVATITFSCSQPGAASFLELTAGQDVTVETDGAAVSYDGERIVLSELGATNTVTVRAHMPYVTDGDGMTAITDPADGERYVSAFTAMDIARRVIPCFDQPDLKTSFTVSVTAPSHWSVFANGRFERRDGDTWHFAPTPRFSTYIFFVTAGPYVSMTWDEPCASAEGGTLPFGWHARASKQTELEREFPSLRETTSAAFAFYTQTFDEPYPFDDYQQVFTPSLNWGAMEFPGCVAFRDEYLTPAAPTAMEQHAMRSVIAHEMAHMWFGDLVTMRWWEDTWLNESFADFMGYEVSGRATGTGAWTAAALGRKLSAYRADARRSTHRIAEDAENLPDVDTAFANFDMITYAKGNAVLRQLAFWLGERDFFAGVNRHLSAHPFGNATLADFLDALDAATDRDVRSWADTWLRTTGFDTIAVTREGDVPVLTRKGRRTHRFTVLGLTPDGAVAREAVVDLADEPVPLPEFAGLAVIANAFDETYAQVSPDEHSRAVLDRVLGSIPNPLTRAMLWASAVSDVDAGRRSLADLVSLASVHLPTETDPTVFEGAVALVRSMVWSHASSDTVSEHLRTLATLARTVLTSLDPDRTPAAARLLARTSADAAELHALRDAAADQALRWLIVRRLAELGDSSVIADEAERDRTTAGTLAAMTAAAASPTAAAKEHAWSQLTSGTLSNREFGAVADGLWCVEQGALLADRIAEAPAAFAALAKASGQAMGQIIARNLPVIPQPDGGAALAEGLRRALATGMPTVAERGFNDALDDLDRRRTHA